MIAVEEGQYVTYDGVVWRVAYGSAVPGIFLLVRLVGGGVYTVLAPRAELLPAVLAVGVATNAYGEVI